MKVNNKRSLAASCFFCVIGVPYFALAGGALVWDKSELEVYPPVKDISTKQKFGFVNASNKTVHITDVQTSCGCTSATLLKHDFAPHEHGIVPVEYNFSRSIGFQEKQIVVITDEEPPQSYVLNLKTYIPSVATISPDSFEWKIGEKCAPKTADITIPESIKASVIDAESTNDNFKVSLKSIKPGTDYSVEVQPRHMDFETRGSVELTVAVEGGERIEKMEIAITPVDSGVSEGQKDSEK